ncbi:MULTISPECIES: hypothetical protein [unclassified Streptomyces]|uniref:hypothetical protein n=1 Tax=unclassified Streptomyces TaxID=2593676 RepID=UPI0005AB2E4A|nr:MULTISPECIES: hypothetical protein [unclassified Streptomyces]ODA74043.1 hypothetical protein APS67_001589 [Streptomyces sp. AVP053U2]
MRGTARRLTNLTGPALAVAAAGLFAAPAAYTAPAGPPHGDGRPAGNPARSLELRPSVVVAGTRVTVDTSACGDGDTVAGDATAVGAGRFTLAPRDDGPDAAGRDSTGRFRVPPGAQPGTYEIVATCEAGGQRVTGDLVVRLTPAAQQVYPRGSVKTGVGGALGTDPAQTAAGVTALAVAAAGGTWLLHRRARGDGI